jgi:hypothetical protein
VKWPKAADGRFAVTEISLGGKSVAYCCYVQRKRFDELVRLVNDADSEVYRRREVRSVSAAIGRAEE